MFKKIVGFGGSFVYGHGLDTIAPPGMDPAKFRLENGLLAFMAKEFGVYADNHGICGASLFDTIAEFRRWIGLAKKLNQDFSEVLVVVGLTNEQRETFVVDEEPWLVSTTLWDPDNREIRWNRERSVWDEFMQHWITTQTVSQVTTLKYWMTANFFDSYCRANGIPLFMFDIFEPVEPIELPTLSTQPSLLQWAHGERTVEERRNLTIDWPKERHLNPTGYKGYAKLLTDDIKQRKLA